MRVVYLFLQQVVGPNTETKERPKHSLELVGFFHAAAFTLLIVSSSIHFVGQEISQ